MEKFWGENVRSTPTSINVQLNWATETQLRNKVPIGYNEMPQNWPLALVTHPSTDTASSRLIGDWPACWFTGMQIDRHRHCQSKSLPVNPHAGESVCRSITNELTTPAYHPNSLQIQSAVLPQCISRETNRPTDRQTDRPTERLDRRQWCTKNAHTIDIER